MRSVCRRLVTQLDKQGKGGVTRYSVRPPTDCTSFAGRTRTVPYRTTVPCRTGLPWKASVVRRRAMGSGFSRRLATGESASFNLLAPE